MVFFTCNACGQAIKKAQVEKHYQQRCRSCEVLSCMDCGKDFYGDEYKLHTQCISEDQKYGGKDYQAPQNANKGEAKQEQWLLRVREAVGAGNISSNIKNLLEQIAEYPNVPRKKSKFENFVRNSLKVHHPKTIEQVWDVFSAATAKPDTSKPTQPVAKETSEAQGTSNSSNSVPDGGVQEKEMNEKAEEMKGKDKRLSKHSETSKSGQKNDMKNAKAGQKRGKDKGASKHSEIRESIVAIASESSESETIQKTKKKKKKKSKASEAENPANERVSEGVKVKAKKKKISKDRNDSKPAENVESDQASSSKEKVGVKKSKKDKKKSKKDKKKKEDSKSDKLLSYSDGEVSFELKLPPKKKTLEKVDQPKSVAKATKSVVNTANGLEEGAAKKGKKKKKKEKIKSFKSQGLLTGTPSEVKRKAKSVEMKQSATGDLKQKEDRGFDSTSNKKSTKLKRKGDKDMDAVIVNKKVKLDVVCETKKAGTSKDKKKKKLNLSEGEKLKSSATSIEIFPLANGHLMNTDKKTAKKKKLRKQVSSFEVKDSRSSKKRNKHDDKHTTPVKRKKKKEKKLPSKHMSPCKIDTSTSSDESGKNLKVKTKKKTGKHKKDIVSKNRETNVKKAHSEKKKKASSGVSSSDNAGEIRTLSSPKTKKKTDVSQNAASNHSNNLDEPASKDSVNGKTKKKKVLPPDKKLKKDKKKSKEPLGVIFPCSPGSNITSFELIGNQLVVHVKKVRTHGQTNIPQGDQKVLQDSSAEPSPRKVAKTSSHLDSTPKKVKKKQGNSNGDLGQWGETDIGGKEVKKKKRKHEGTNSQPGDQNGTLSPEPSLKKAKKSAKEKRKKTLAEPSTETPEETAAEKVEETSIESSTEEVKKKKKKKKKQEISGDGDQESSDVKKKKKRKHKETNGQLADVSGNSLAETSPKRVKKNPIESSTEKAMKKKKKKKKQSSGDDDQVASSEMNGSEKAGKKTKSKRKEDASSNETKVTNGLTSLPSVPSGDSSRSKKKKKSKESTLISDSSKPDAPSIDGSEKTKKKTKKEKRDSGSEKGSPVKTGTKLKGVVVKSVEMENGLGTTEVKKSKKGAKKSKDPNNNPVSFSTISPINKSIKTNPKSEKSLEKKKKSHKKDKSKESSDKSGIAEAKDEVKKVKKSKKVKVK